MIRQVFQADREVNEITAHAKAAVRLHPDVDTIIEIGGQDSKFTRIRDGDVYFSTMNYVCAAGTGSFIEEQARRLGVSLAEFSDMATTESAPFTSDRCTVYMERDLSALLGEGWSREALAAAVLHSVRDNYLSKVVGKSPLGETHCFPGRHRPQQGAGLRRSSSTSGNSPCLPVLSPHGSPGCGAALPRPGHRRVARFAWETGPCPAERGVPAVREPLPPHGDRAARGHAHRVGGMKCGRDYAERKPAAAGPCR